MAAAVPPTVPLFSALYGDPTKWENFASDYAVLNAAFGKGTGGAASLQAPQCRDGLVQLSTRTPVVLAFVCDAECDHVYVAHSLTLFPGDVTDPTALDNLVVGLVGDGLATAVPVVLPQPFFTLTPNVSAYNVGAIQGAAGHGANPPVFRHGPHAAGDPDTSELRSRRAILLPPHLAGLALRGAPADGRYTLLHFYNTFLQAILASGVAAEIAVVEPVTQWWRLACTNVAGGTSVVSSALRSVTSPREQARLHGWVSRVKDSQMSRIGVGGPGLSNAAFAHGVNELRASLESNHRATLEFERARNEKTFTDLHGATTAEKLHRLCNVASDDLLPEVHGLLLKTAKARTYAVLASLFASRARASTTIPLDEATAPLATPKLVDDVFRNYTPGGDGVAFGRGLSPFAIVLPGHEGIADIQKAIQQAQMLESGTSLSLADAQVLLSDDVRFPTQAYIAIEKLYGWSLVVDVFHGVTHPVSVSIREAVVAIGPQLQRLSSFMGDTPAAGMELIHRVMFDMQQDYFSYLATVAAGGTVAAPTFAKVIDLVKTFRANCLSPLPANWYLLQRPGAPVATPPGVPPSETRPTSLGAAVVNPHTDSRLRARFQGSGHTTISAMIGGRSLTYPSQGGKPVCMSWALKGSCNTNCKRAAQHVRYSQTTVTALHAFLTECGVANPQP